MSHRYLPLLAALLAPLWDCRPRPEIPVPQGNYRIELTEEGRVNVTATATPASRILDQLRTTYGVAVEIPEFQDRVITDHFVGLTLDSAIRRLLPGARPHIVVATGDRLLPADTGAKLGRRTPRPVGVPRKDTVPVFPLNDSLRSKAKPDTAVSRPRPVGPGLKVEPVDTAQPARVLPKRPSSPIQDSTRYLWASLLITTRGELRVESARILEGSGVISTVPEGTYYYLITAAGRPVALGSFADPFERRAYAKDPRGPHQTARADTGRFVLTAPWTALANVEPQAIGVQVLRVRAGAAPPPVELQRAVELLRTLEPVATLAPGTLLRALPQRD